MPDGARHDADICPFCSEKAAQESSHASVPSSSEELSGAVTNQPPQMEGGTPDMSTATTDALSRETHEALLDKALKDATAALDEALASKSDEAKELASQVEELTTKNTELASEVEELNKKLDEAQVQLKAATDEIATLKADVAAKEEAARLADVASARAAQVKNLGLFAEDYISEKASKWAELADDEWTERLDEWQAAKPAADRELSDSASAMSGSSESLTAEPPVETASENKPSARRAALGLTS